VTAGGADGDRTRRPVQSSQAERVAETPCPFLTAATAETPMSDEEDDRTTGDLETETDGAADGRESVDGDGANGDETAESGSTPAAESDGESEVPAPESDTAPDEEATADEDENENENENGDEGGAAESGAVESGTDGAEPNDAEPDDAEIDESETESEEPDGAETDEDEEPNDAEINESETESEGEESDDAEADESEESDGGTDGSGGEEPDGEAEVVDAEAAESGGETENGEVTDDGDSDGDGDGDGGTGGTDAGAEDGEVSGAETQETAEGDAEAGSESTPGSASESAPEAPGDGKGDGPEPATADAASGEPAAGASAGTLADEVARVSRDAESAADVDGAALREATTALWRGDLVVYPTETVYGLAADALDERAVERVFETKERDRSEPLSIAVPDVTSALEYAAATARTREFMREFLPGAVTVVCERRPKVPDVVTAGGDRVGVRVPDEPVALALLRRVAPLTATSANRSGRANARIVADLDATVRDAAVVLDGGETPGGESTVVDVDGDEVIRAGERAEAVREWLAEN
jgi:L-threonylcarbamoyladenylate synthase